ncbi:hypothetical protein MJC1_03000 [Methylocystis sp. MJC1]|nr:hypothetical protein MJC1_03000 [Methylocystis sp. MJC1]MBU6528369.1 putative DNA-binding domain-containing protein [Methylocystis sp. MJC1]
MQTPENYAEEFLRALLDRNAPVPVSLKRSSSHSVVRRFAIYQNNLFSRLIDNLEARFPVCKRLVGDSFFRALASEYIRRSPPGSPILIEYGADLPDFISGFGPARALPYLPDVARLEYDIGRAYDAADAAPVSNQVLVSMSPDQIAGSRLQLHPSATLHSFAYPIVSIWRTNSFDDEVKVLDATEPEDALIVRSYLNVEVHRLPAGGFRFMRSLADGQTILHAAADAQLQDSRFDLAACVELVISARAIVAIDPAPLAISS